MFIIPLPLSVPASDMQLFLSFLRDLAGELPDSLFAEFLFLKGFLGIADLADADAMAFGTALPA